MVFRNFSFKASAIVISLATLAACSSGSARLTPSFVPQAPMFGGSFHMNPFAGTAVKKIVWPKLPKATAGKAIKKGVKIKLVAKGANGAPISGAYTTPIVVTNTDKTGASKLFVNGKAAGKKNPLKSSTDVLTLTYSGLAIVPATFQAASGAVKAKTTFKPTLSAIVYTGPKVTGPEIDLTSNVPATTGFSGNFTATEKGWTPAPYSRAFTYKFAAIGGQTNNCPGTAGSAYKVTPASGAKGTAFTVSGAATAAAGECAMTISGGGGKTLLVTLTYTTTSVGVNSEHQ